MHNVSSELPKGSILKETFSARHNTENTSIFSGCRFLVTSKLPKWYCQNERLQPFAISEMTKMFKPLNH